MTVLLNPAHRTFPAFNLNRLLRTVFEPTGTERVAILIDLEDPREVKDFGFLGNPDYSVQRYAIEDFYRPLAEGRAAEIGLKSADLYAYQITGGSNLDLPDQAFRPDGSEVSLARDVYPHYELILAISTYSATAPLTAHAKTFGFRGATLHGLNKTIMESGLAVDYHVVSTDAEKLRLGMTRADKFEIDFTVGAHTYTLALLINGQEAQKSHGLCLGTKPDVANLPAGEVYFVPEGAEGEFPMRYEDGTLGIMEVSGGRIQRARLLKGNPETIDAHNAKLQSDPVTGELGELGFGTQVLPVSGRDIQDEKILGTVHVATGRSDHLGGHLTPDRFAQGKNATHDDILYAPFKTPEIHIPEVRMYRDGEVQVTHRDFQPAEYLVDLLSK